MTDIMDMIDAYAEARHRCGGVYNAKTEAARKTVIEALSGVQALSAAPAIAKLRHLYQNMVNGAVRDTASAKRIAEGLLAPAIEALERATPPAEQAAPPTAQAEGWVSVEERLPAKNTEVLICFAESTLPSTGQYTGLAEDPAGWCYPKESYLWPGESEKLPDGGAPTVTHWMPIPLLPTSAEGVEP